MLATALVINTSSVLTARPDAARLDDRGSAYAPSREKRGRGAQNGRASGDALLVYHTTRLAGRRDDQSCPDNNRMSICSPMSHYLTAASSSGAHAAEPTMGRVYALLSSGAGRRIERTAMADDLTVLIANLGRLDDLLPCLESLFETVDDR